ncbi:hypothetical protein HPP92_025946 [Vanilla planifolia]|uniref:Flavin-containing monooxygenase n=1 Tax=Vanilla planifolia TaxID=51239 RepID=A0A835PNB2_VANPL|nr:hypothetical protein HPP92_025946 [Vanilla planifolia]
MVVRTKRWNLPSLTAWGIPLKYFYFTRFGELFFHKPREGLFSWVLATLLSPLVWIISKLAESYYKKTIPMHKYGMVPEHSFFQALSSCLLCILPCRFYDMVKQGSIVLKPSNTFKFCQRGIVIDGQNSPIDADLVIFATGYRGDQKLKNIFVSPWFQKIVTDSQGNIVPLYRECIHPQIPQMAIIGYTESMSNLHTSEMCARWLACFLHGNFKLPSKRCMEKVVREWVKQTRRHSKIKSRGSCISTLHIWKNDQLLNDMGCNPRRKKGKLANWFLPYSPEDYAEIEYKDEKKIVH